MYKARIKATSHNAAKAVLERIYKLYDVLFTEDMKSVTGAALTAQIVLDDDGTDYRTVEIWSNYYADHSLEKLAEEVKGRGKLLPPAGLECIYIVDTEDSIGNEYEWPLLTRDGGDPGESVYYFLHGDSPSSYHMQQINAAIEEKKWRLATFLDLGLAVEDFNI